LKNKSNDKTIPDFYQNQNTFIANQNQYRSIVAKYIKERNNAYVIAIVMFIVTMIAIASTVYLATQSRVQAVIFNQDGQFIGIPNIKTKINDKAMITNQIAEYIIDLYSVPADITTKEHNVTKVVSMTDSNYFNNYVLSIIKQNLLKNRDTQVTVKINSIVLTNTGEWSIDYSTWVGDHKTDSFKTLVNYRQDLNLDKPEKILNNPLGIFVTSLETQELME
jgi:type IV secretory pathway TrbF-like protein